MREDNLPKVLVVVATKNEERNIGRCLESLKLQSYPEEKIELIVVDNNSSDKTRKIATRFTNKVFNLPQLIDLKKIKNYRGAQINFGVRKSKGEIVFFPDADMVFEADLLKEAVDLISRKGIEALYIPETVLGRGFFGKTRNFERNFYNGTCIDAVRIVRKDIFLKVGGFDEKNIFFGPDDWDFTKMLKRITSKIAITNSRVFHHEETATISKYLKKKREYMVTFGSYIQKWGKDDPDIKKQFSLWYRYFGVFIEKGKWKKLIEKPFLTLGMYFLRVGVGIIFMKKRISQ